MAMWFLVQPVKAPIRLPWCTDESSLVAFSWIFCRALTWEWAVSLENRLYIVQDYLLRLTSLRWLLREASMYPIVLMTVLQIALVILHRHTSWSIRTPKTGFPAAWQNSNNCEILHLKNNRAKLCGELWLPLHRILCGVKMNSWNFLTVLLIIQFLGATFEPNHSVRFFSLSIILYVDRSIHLFTPSCQWE